MKFASYEPNRIRIFRCSCVKNFRESYVFHCLVIKVVCLCDSLFTLSYLFYFVKHFFKFFQSFSTLSFSQKVVQIHNCQLCSSDLITLTRLFQVVKHFFKFLFFFQKSIKIVPVWETIISDSSTNITLLSPTVNPLFYFFYLFLFFIIPSHYSSFHIPQTLHTLPIPAANLQTL